MTTRGQLAYSDPQPVLRTVGEQQPDSDADKSVEPGIRRRQEIPVTVIATPCAEEATLPAKKPSKPKRKKKKTGNNSKRTRSPGTTRGIETMFRSSYRTQLDLTALAATKANMMISLNGFILSVLTLSGPFVLVAEPLFTVPIAVFLGTCLVSIIFAVLAAQPRRLKVHPTSEDFKKDRASPLIFEEFSHLSEKAHMKAMRDVMSDSTRTYNNMSRQIYMLGTVANRKFRMLGLSYATFLAGLTISTLLLLAIGYFHHTPDLASIFSQLNIRTQG